MKKIVLIIWVSLPLSCSQGTETGFLDENAQFTETGLEYIMLEEGEGPNPEYGLEVVTHCILKIGDSTEVWNTRSGEPYVFQYAETGQIRGFIEAIGMMSKGGRMKVIIPPEMGYGPQAFGDIPANAYLSFDIEILEIRDLMLWIADSLYKKFSVEDKEAAMAFYQEMKADRSGKYELNERQLMTVGSKLRNDGRLNDFLEVALLRVKEFPESIGAHFALANVYEERGENQQAIQSYERCLELAPGNPAVLGKLEELK